MQHASAAGAVAGTAEPDVVERRAIGVPGVLQRAVLEQQLGADRADARRAGIDHLRQPVGGDDFGVVVQQQQVLASRVRGTEVDDGGEVERLARSRRSALRPELAKLVRHRRWHLPAGDDDHLDVDVRRCQHDADRLDDERSLSAADRSGRRRCSGRRR